MDKKGDNLTKKDIWKLLKKNAPSLFYKYAKTRINHLTSELNKLRQDWLVADLQTKKKIELYAFDLKADIKILINLLEDEAEKPEDLFSTTSSTESRREQTSTGGE